MSGRLISLEGLDGAGKSTQAALLLDYCRGRGWDTRLFREPGGTPLGEELRRLIKSGMAESPAAELFLFGAARSELLMREVEPALEAGCTVLLDRFSDSSRAYQGALEFFDPVALEDVCRLAARGNVPELTLWLDSDPASALQRRTAASAADAIELRNLDYFQRVRAGYARLAAVEPQRIRRIDAARSIEEVAAQIRGVMEDIWPI